MPLLRQSYAAKAGEETRVFRGPEFRIGMKQSLAGLFVVAALAAGLTPARAADMAPARVQAVPNVVAPVPFSWSGFYLGVNGGYGWGRSNWDDPATDPSRRSFGLSGGVV